MELSSAPLFPRHRTEAELGVLQLSRGQYVDALDLLMKSGWWLDAAYVAERVLSEDELVAYVDRHCPPGAHPELRHLLARRLTRSGHWKAARAYFPEKLRSRLDAYIDGIRKGNDAKLEPAVRAEALWTAATIARREGMELLGTELTPDDFADGGDYTGSNVPEARPETKDALLPVSADEVTRVNDSAPQPWKRFHYRYIAIDHARAAFELMPDNSIMLSRRLCEAGNWVKARDPATADKFYKLLITRRAQTPLGKAAIQAKWFPDVPPGGL